MLTRLTQNHEISHDNEEVLSLRLISQQLCRRDVGVTLARIRNEATLVEIVVFIHLLEVIFVEIDIW